MKDLTAIHYLEIYKKRLEMAERGITFPKQEILNFLREIIIVLSNLDSETKVKLDINDKTTKFTAVDTGELLAEYHLTDEPDPYCTSKGFLRFLTQSCFILFVSFAMVYLILKIWPEPAMGDLIIIGLGIILFGWFLLSLVIDLFLRFLNKVTNLKCKPAEKYSLVFGIVPVLVVIFAAFIAYESRLCRNELTRVLPENCMRCCGLIGDCGCKS